MNNLQDKWIEEELTIVEFCERFIGVTDFSTPDEYDVSQCNIKILGKDLTTGEDTYKKLKTFVVKSPVNEYYTDGKLKGTNKHRIIENGKEIHLENHPDFKRKAGNMNVVDFQVEGIHNYYANGRLNHNTVPGGKALSYATSVRIRLANLGKLKVTRNGQKEVIGMKCSSQLIKNRCGPGYRTAQFEIHYDSGIQDLSSWLNYMKLYGLISGDKSGYTFKRADGTKVEFDTAKFVELVNTDAALKEEVYQAICNNYIMEYRSPNTKIVEDVEETNSEDDDISKDAVKEEE